MGRVAMAAACFALAGAAPTAQSLARDTRTPPAGDLAHARQTYQKYCRQCHGEKGDGLGPVGKTLDPPLRDFRKGEFKFGTTDQDLFDVISNGAAARGGNDLMAGWNEVISEPDRWGLVQFVRSLKK